MPLSRIDPKYIDAIRVMARAKLLQKDFKENCISMMELKLGEEKTKKILEHIGFFDDVELGAGVYLSINMEAYEKHIEPENFDDYFYGIVEEIHTSIEELSNQ